MKGMGMAEKKLTDAELRSYMDAESELWENDLYVHFGAFGFRDWTDVSLEGRRVYGVMFDMSVEPESPIDDLLSAVAAESFDAAILSVAEMLGCRPDALRCVVASWSEAPIDEAPTPPLADISALGSMIAAYLAWLDSGCEGDPPLRPTTASQQGPTRAGWRSA